MPRRAPARVGARFSRASALRSVIVAALCALVVVPALASPALAAGGRLPAVALPTCPTSGTGLTLTTTAPLHYVPAGTQPIVRAAAASGEIRYTVRERNDVMAGATVPETTVAASPAGVALQLPEALPGFYEVAASLVIGGATVAQSCLRYGVGAAGADFDPASLPAGADWGGPGPERGVAISSALGFGDIRGGVDFGYLFRNGTFDAGIYDASFRAAAARARAAGVVFHVQVGQNSAAEVAAVKDGTWGPKVEQLVKHFAGVVTAWEAWNEPDAFYADGHASTYVRNVLTPFSQAVRRADPAAQVVGGSTLGFSESWFTQFGQAGGFGLVDVVAMHAYTADNRDWTEAGTPQQFQRLRAVMTRFGAGAKPIWNTESAWWSTGDYNLYAGAGKTAKSLILARALGVRMAAFLIEGGWQDWSLIDPQTGVKPGALAGIATKVLLGDKGFIGFVDTGMPHVTAVRFDGVTVAWTDGPSVTAAVSGATVSYDVLGRPVAGSAGQLTLTDTPTYLVGNATVRGSAPGVNLVRGAAVTVTSGSGATGAVDGRTDNAGLGDLTSAWVASSSDPHPALTVTLPKAATVRSVVVTTPSNGSVIPGLRDYTISLRDARGRWKVAARQSGQVWTRTATLPVTPQVATAVRISIEAVNDTGIRQDWPGDNVPVESGPRTSAVVQELEVYGAFVPTPAAKKAPPVKKADAKKPVKKVAAKR